MKIQIIAEASKKHQRFFKNWGLSILIDNKILFDTFSNPEVLKKGFKKNHIDISLIKYVVISHEHWDHIGGLWWLLENNNKVTVILNRSFSNDLKEKINYYGIKIIELHKDFYKIIDNIYSTGEIEGLYKEKIIYEQSLVIVNNNKIMLLTGCAHPGVIKIVQKVMDEFNNDISLLVGGFHLLNKSPDEVEKIILQLKNQYMIERIAPCHCTGKKATHILKSIFNSNFIKITSNKLFDF